MWKLFKHLLLLSGFYLLSSYLLSNKNNVCKTFGDYNLPEGNENCYHDADATLDTPEIIEKYAGKVETHEVTTEDNYILTLFRIPRPNAKGVILLHHSIATHSKIYLWKGNDSLAITLWRNGFEVWLANQRGTSYSSKHTRLSQNDFRYWNFSFHEMGLYDVSSEIDLIREKTNGSKIIYFGHSLGSTIGLIYSSLKPDEAKNYLKTMILAAPACYFEHSSNTMGWMINFRILFLVITDSTSDHSYASTAHSKYNAKLIEFAQIGSPFLLLPLWIHSGRIFLRLFPMINFVAAILVCCLCGFTLSELDPTFFNYDATDYLNNFSWKTVHHFYQMVSKNTFQMFDYDEEKNFKIYGSESPPLYPIGEIKVPTLIVSSEEDNLVTVKDVERLYEELSPEAKVHGHWKLPYLNHVDYLIGLSRKELFVDVLMNFLNNLK